MNRLLKFKSKKEQAKKPVPIPNSEFDNPWRQMNWSEREKSQMLRELQDFQSGTAEVRELNILLYGPVGAGKSSFINSVDTVLQGHITTGALANSAAGSSFTVELKHHRLRKGRPGSFYPFVFADIMGLEEDKVNGVQTDDIIKILQGHVKGGYAKKIADAGEVDGTIHEGSNPYLVYSPRTSSSFWERGWMRHRGGIVPGEEDRLVENIQFNPVKPISKDDPKYLNQPRLKHQVHCLVSVLPGDRISLITGDVIQKMIAVREKARGLGIPQVIIMSLVDRACPLVNGKLEKIYTSRKIKDKMQECSHILGVPMNCIYPVQNYNEQIANDVNMDILILTAMTNIIRFANAHVEDQVYNANEYDDDQVYNDDSDEDHYCNP